MGLRNLPCCMLLLCGPHVATAQDSNQSTPVQALRASLDIMKKLPTIIDPKMMVPRDLLRKCSCLVVIPATEKLGLRRQVNEGILVCREDARSQSWGRPLLVKLTGATIPRYMDVLVLVMDQEAIETFLADSVGLGSDISVSVGPTGYIAIAPSREQRAAQSLGYSLSLAAGRNGKMDFQASGVDLTDCSVVHDDLGNRQLYVSGLDYSVLLRHPGVSPTAAKELFPALAKITGPVVAKKRASTR